MGVQSITINVNDTNIDLPTQGILATIDTSVADLWLPPSLCDAFATNLNLTYHNASDRYVIPSSIQTLLQSTSPTFTFTLGTSVSDGETIDIELPYAALALEADYPIFAEPTTIFGIRRAANDTQFTIGRALLQEVYLGVDWEREIFNISRAHFSAPMPDEDIVAIEPKLELVETGTKPSGGKKGLSKGAIAGIVVGAVVVFVLVAAAAWWVVRRRRRRRREKLIAAGEAVTVVEDEKKGHDGDDAPEVGGPGARDRDKGRTDVELGGRPVDLAELGSTEGGDRRGGETGELDAAEGEHVYELASPVAELPTPVAELPGGDSRK